MIENTDDFNNYHSNQDPYQSPEPITHIAKKKKHRPQNTRTQAATDHFRSRSRFEVVIRNRGYPFFCPNTTPITTPNVSSSKASLGIQHGGPNNASCSPAPGSSTEPLPNTPAPVDFEALVAKLLDPNGDVKLKVHLITELREMIELCSRDVEFTKHLDIIISAVVEILSSTRPVQFLSRRLGIINIGFSSSTFCGAFPYTTL
ncbi:hypothetical protein PGTUg99_009633 [Puccinia graminis f. sp. tritici]|uniref:Uncharacterized protein n=1 Tax=Puccinia graminis f. sp. tritici TaxID=56615 RepID=A0A5B0PSQ9_PUCGR|nr:hypothetical protein PGTUg99_009633 [Puccinia graminis f. sp. tritici]